MSSVERSSLDQLQLAVERLRLDDDFRISCNDLFAVCEASGCSLQNLLVSLEHLAFYLRSTDAAGIRNPKAWMLKKLRAGYFGPPANFVSWEVQQEAEMLRAARERAVGLRRMQQGRFEAEFEIWKLEQPPGALATILNEFNPQFAASPSSPPGQAMLRRHFANSTGREELLEESQSFQDGREGP